MQDFLHGTQDVLPHSTPGERVAVTGSRRYPHPAEVTDYVATLPSDTVVIVSGQYGADAWAAEAARARGLQIEIYYALWLFYGRAARYKRAVRVVNEADRVVAFWDGRSKGTGYIIALAQRWGKPVEVHSPVEASL